MFYRFTMNKPFTNILICSSTNILIFSYMQNEPNFTHKAPTKHAKDEGFTHIFSKKNTKFYEILQNNPKVYSQKPLFLINSGIKSRRAGTLFPSFSITFTHFSTYFTRLRRLFVLFCNFQTLTHLTPYTTKPYINIPPQHTTYEIRARSFTRLRRKK